MYELKHDEVLKLYLQKIQEVNQSQKEVATRLKISRSIVWKLSNKKPISMKTFTKLVEFLEINPEDYIQKKATETDWRKQKSI